MQQSKIKDNDQLILKGLVIEQSKSKMSNGPP